MVRKEQQFFGTIEQKCLPPIAGGGRSDGIGVEFLLGDVVEACNAACIIGLGVGAALLNAQSHYILLFAIHSDGLWQPIAIIGLLSITGFIHKRDGQLDEVSSKGQVTGAARRGSIAMICATTLRYCRRWPQKAMSPDYGLSPHRPI